MFIFQLYQFNHMPISLLNLPTWTLDTFMVAQKKFLNPYKIKRKVLKNYLIIFQYFCLRYSYLTKRENYFFQQRKGEYTFNSSWLFSLKFFMFVFDFQIQAQLIYIEGHQNLFLLLVFVIGLHIQQLLLSRERVTSIRGIVLSQSGCLMF